MMVRVADFHNSYPRDAPVQTCVSVIHRPGVWQQSDQSVPTREHISAQICQYVHRTCGEHRYDLVINVFIGFRGQCVTKHFKTRGYLCTILSFYL